MADPPWRPGAQHKTPKVVPVSRSLTSQRGPVFGGSLQGQHARSIVGDRTSGELAGGGVVDSAG
eukprot:6966590-Pyramimonas_sp.AAC.1